MVAAAPPPQRPSLPSLPDDHLPDPHAVVTEAVDEKEMPLPSDPKTLFLGGLFALGVLAALYVASSIILPVVLVFVLNLLLKPAVRLLSESLLCAAQPVHWLLLGNHGSTVGARPLSPFQAGGTKDEQATATVDP